MQRHGLLVLRFLAEDVTTRLRGVVGRIAEAVETRRAPQAQTPGGSPVVPESGL